MRGGEKMDTRKMNRLESIIVVTFILIVVAGLVFSGITPKPAAAQTKVVKVGIDIGLTGFAAAWGKHAWNTYQLAFDKINAEGGIKAFGGAKIEYKVMDTESKPDIAASNAEKLISWGASVVFGCNQSGAAMTASQVCQRTGIPFIDTTDADPMITGRGFKWVFRTCPMAAQLVPSAVEFMNYQGKMTGLKPTKVALLTVEQAFGASVRPVFAEGIKKHGYNLAEDIPYPTDQKDFTGVINKLKTQAVDFVCFVCSTPDSILLTRTFKEMDFNPIGHIGIIGGQYTDDFIKTLGKDADYTFDSCFWTPDLKVPRMADLMKEYKTRFGLDFDATDATVINAIAVFRDALERAGMADPEKLRAAISTADLNLGRYGYLVPDGCKFDSTGQNVKQKAIVFQIMDGKWRSVYPPEVAASKAVWPILKWSDRR
jgi:branched-chain amino acid transport system substrate-binding protein